MIRSSNDLHAVEGEKTKNRKMDVGPEISQINKESIEKTNLASNFPVLNAGDSILNSLVEQRSGIRKMREANPLSRAALENKKIIHHEMENKDVINKFRNIRTKLFDRDSQKNSTVLVCAPKSGGGCSFFSTNLAAAISLEETKTALLVDCNLDNPTITNTFSYESEIGLTDYLDQPGIDLDQVIHPSGISRFRVVPVGTQTEGSSEYFTSIRMRQFLQSTKARYPDRYIIIDAPPVLSSADTSILASMCDKVIIVIPYGEIQESDLDSTIDAVGPEKLTGIIFNENLY